MAASRPTSRCCRRWSVTLPPPVSAAMRRPWAVVDNNDQSTGGVRSTLSQEAVREFQVLTNSFSAEFGKAVGGVVNIVTRSGTNDLRGVAFGYYRDEALNA